MELKVGILIHVDFEDKINAKRKISLGNIRLHILFFSEKAYKVIGSTIIIYC